jgi:hypothetical protein
MADRLNLLGMDEAGIRRVFRTFNASAPAFLAESTRHEREVAP